MILTDEEIQRRATYHPPTDVAKKWHEQVRETYSHAAQFTNQLPDGRENSVAQTKLEEWMFWANAAIARNHDKL